MSDDFYDVEVEDELQRLKANLAASTAISANFQAPSLIPFDALGQNLKCSIKNAGLRSGETRSWQEVQEMYEKIPDGIRRQSTEAIEHYKDNHDWSHDRSHCNGGSSSPENGNWENPNLNRARRDHDMTADEVKAMEKAKARINFQANTQTVLTSAATAGGIAFAVEGAFSGLENFIAVQRGEKSIEEALVDTLADSTGAAISAAVITGGVIAISIAFPPIGAAVGTAMVAVAPVLKIVGLVGCATRLVAILSSSPKVQGMDSVHALMSAYGIDEIMLDFRDLEVEDELTTLKLNMGIA